MSQGVDTALLWLLLLLQKRVTVFCVLVMLQGRVLNLRARALTRMPAQMGAWGHMGAWGTVGRRGTCTDGFPGVFRAVSTLFLPVYFMRSNRKKTTGHYP